MHGVKRQPKTAATAEARAARKAKEAAKLQAYLEIEQTFFTYKRQSRADTAALEHTTTLLTLNPELYTVWNYRREILLDIFKSGVGEEDRHEAKPDVFASLRDSQASKDGDEVGKGDEGGQVEASLDKEREAEAREQERTRRNQALLEDDLTLTEHALRAHPKVYWIWNHRMWCLTQYPPLPSSSSSSSASASTSNSNAQWVWERELKLVEKMLDLDPRNFHGWNCRRAIVEHLALSIVACDPDLTAQLQTGNDKAQLAFPSLLSHPLVIASDGTKAKLLALADRELGYALRKIESNFSNFSAWHQRTKLLPHVWAARRLDVEAVDAQVDQELELIKQAMYTDPSDQSVWFYHRWLVELLIPTAAQQQQEQQQQEQRGEAGEKERKRRTRQMEVLEEEVNVIDELFELEPDSKWCAISLAHYHTLLAELYSTTEDADEKEKEKAGKYKTKANELLEQLIELDPDREARYRDLLEGKAHF